MLSEIRPGQAKGPSVGNLSASGLASLIHVHTQNEGVNVNAANILNAHNPLHITDEGAGVAGLNCTIPAYNRMMAIIGTLKALNSTEGIEVADGGSGRADLGLSIMSLQNGLTPITGIKRLDILGTGLKATNPVAGTLGLGVDPTTTTNVVASTTQTQGQQPLTTDYNLVITVANPYDVVTLKPALVGQFQIVANIGLNSLQIYPAAGEYINDKPVNGTIILQPFETYTFRAMATGRWLTENAWNEHVRVGPVMRIQTVNATETTFVPGTLTLDDDCLYNIEVSIIGMETDSNQLLTAKYNFGVYRKNGGNATLLGAINMVMLDRTDPAMSVGVKLTGSNVEPTVFGLAATTIYWTGYWVAFRMREL